MKNYREMTNEEINGKIKEFSRILDSVSPVSDEWDEAYMEYNKLVAIQDERYREENADSFNAFYEKHIKGKKWEEIDPEAWVFYSDWHKDMYGYRPHSI